MSDKDGKELNKEMQLRELSHIGSIRGFGIYLLTESVPFIWITCRFVFYNLMFLKVVHSPQPDPTATILRFYITTDTPNYH